MWRGRGGEVEFRSEDRSRGLASQNALGWVLYALGFVQGCTDMILLCFSYLQDKYIYVDSDS